MRWTAALPLAFSVLFAQNAPRPRITGVAHIAIYAKDLEKSRAFYRDFLGYEEPYSLTKPDGSPSMTFFKINERQYLELSPETAPGSDRLNHIAIETDNAEAMRLYLAAHGVAVPVRVGKGRIGNSNFNVKDPEGHTIEIVQYEPDSWTVRERGRHLPESRISKRIMHVGIIVTSFDATMKFYCDLLRFHETWRGSRSDTELNWVNLQVPDGQDYIELMLYKDAPPADQRGSAHHLALEVAGAARGVADLEARPYRKRYTRPIEIRTGINRRRQVNLFDPDGTRTELMEPGTVDGKLAPSSQAPPPGSAAALGIFEGHSDVGAVLHAGSAQYDAAQRTYTVAGSGENMWFAADALHMIWKKVSGDVTLTADVSFVGTGGDAHRKAVLMMRQSLDADSAYADAALHGDGLTSLQSRGEKGAATHEIQSHLSAPQHLRLTRQGEYFYMSVGGDGENIPLAGGWMRVPMSGTFYVGIGVCAHNKDRVEQAVFSNVDLRPAMHLGTPVLHSTIEYVKVPSTDRRAVYIAPGRIRSPGFSRDGAVIVFTSDGKRYRVALDSDKPEAISGDAPEDSPVGEYIYYNSDGGGRMQIWRRRADGTGAEQLTFDDLNNWFPHASPDGRSVAFLSCDKSVSGTPDDKDVTIRLLSLADRKIKVLATLIGGRGSMEAPSWSPDGAKLAFVSYQFIQ